MDAEASSSEPAKGAHHFALRLGTKLLEFEIEEVLGHGGFGITYRAVDTTLKETVAVKEFFPNALAGRVSSITVSAKSESDQGDFEAGLKAFLEEARLITRFRHPNIVHVRRFFEMHGTGYIVLDYERGQTLSKRLGAGAVSEAELRGILAGLLAGLEAMHERAILHRDLKPSNVIIREDGTAVLIDFGAARDFAGRNSRSITAIAAPGYSPPEQYGVGEQQQGPWTDLYSLGAIAYRCVTGTVPVDSLRRLRKDPLIPAVTAAAGKYDPALLRTIDWMLRLEEGDRPASVNDVRTALASGVLATPQGMRRPLLWAASAAAALIAIAAIAAASTGLLSTITCEFRLFCSGQSKTADASPKPETVSPSAASLASPAAISSPPTAPTAAALSDVAEAWAATKDTTSIAVLETYAARYKDTFYGDLARSRIEELKRQQAAAPISLPTAAAASPPSGVAVPTTPPASAQDDAAWDKLKESRNADRWRAFLDQNTMSPHRAEATTRLAMLEPKVTDCDTLAADRYDSHKVASVPDLERNNPGYGINIDVSTATPACEQAVRDFPDAARLQYQLGRVCEKLKKYEDAREWYAKAADSGYPAAMSGLGFLYMFGLGVAKDSAEARRLQAKAADLGYSPAMDRLGDLYSAGSGVTRDYDVARNWYFKAAALGNADAMFTLGRQYLLGQGVQIDYGEARKWYTKAADLDHAWAIYNLAWLYANGQGVQRNYGEARQLLMKIAERGNTSAMEDLGRFYANGSGVPRDYGEARRWIVKAAEIGNFRAMTDLGKMYENGTGVTRNYSEARRWYEKAAAEGDEDAKKALQRLGK